MPLGLEPAGLERGALAGRHGLGQGGVGLLDGGLDLQQALLLAGAAGGVPGAEDVPGRGHRGDLRALLDQGPGGGQVGDDRDPVEQRGEPRAQLDGALDDVDGPGRVGRECGPLPRRGQRRAVGEQQGGPPEVVALEVSQRRQRRGDVADGDGLGGGPERGGDRGLVAVAHRQQRGQRTEDALEVVGGQQRSGAVPTGQAELQRLLAGGEAVPVAVGLLGALAHRGQPLLDVVERRDGLLVLRVEALLAGVEAGDLRLQGGEGQLRPLGAGQGVLAALPQALDLLVGAGGA